MPVTQSGSNAQATFGTYNDIQNTTTGSFNTIINGVAGRAAVTSAGAFYAYIHNIADDGSWRIVIIFASREIADEWWRAVSSTNIDILKNNIKRITPQFYTHDTRHFNIFHFFVERRLKDISEKFRGKMFLVLENDRGGRGITIIPTQSIIDRASGDWFAIRSKANANHHWYYDEAQRCILVSATQRTSFRVSAPNMHDGAIMIGVDDIILVAQHHGFIIPQPSSPRTLGVTVTQSQAFKFKFSDLEEGKFIPSPGAVFPSPLCYVPEGGAGTGWELTL